MNPATSCAGCEFQSSESLSEPPVYPSECPVASNAAYDLPVSECRSQFELCDLSLQICAENFSSNNAEACCDSFSDVSDSSFSDSECNLNGLPGNLNGEMPHI